MNLADRFSGVSTEPIYLYIYTSWYRITEGEWRIILQRVGGWSWITVALATDDATEIAILQTCSVFSTLYSNGLMGQIVLN